MKLKWKDQFKEESNKRLFEIFSEKKRINIEPQIFAGNILHGRNCNPESLIKTKQELIDSIEVAFQRKFYTDPKQIKKENIIRELVLKSILAIAVFLIFYCSTEFRITYSFVTIGNISIAYILAIVSFLPLLRIKKSNDNAIKKVLREKEKKDNMVQKIKTELRF